jgi:hypothetical protein
MPRQSVEVLPLFAVQDAWNKLPTADPGAVLTPYEGGEAQGVVPEDGLGCLNDVENKAGGSGEQYSSAREGLLTPPLLPTLEATPTPAQNILARQITPGAFPDDDSTTDALPISPQVSVQVLIQARAALPALDPSSPSWAL